MPDEDSLDSLMSDEKVETVESNLVEEATTDETEETTSTEDKVTEGEESEENKSTEEKSKTDTEEFEGKSESWQMKAYLDEKDKRQEREREIDKLRSQIPKAEPVKVERPDIFEDPAKALDFEKATMTNAFEAKLLNQRVDISRAVMSEKEGFAEKEAGFTKLINEQIAAGDKTLALQMINDPMPWKFAFDHMIKVEEMEAMEDLPTLQLRLKNEAREEVLKEMAEKNTTAADLLKDMPPSITDKGSSNAGTSATTTDESLTDILGR